MPERAKRTVLTPQQQIDKARAALAAAESKAAKITGKKVDALLERRSTLMKQINERHVKVAKIDAELVALGADDELAAVTSVVPDGEITVSEDTFV